MDLFVYGTLRRAAAHPMHAPLRAAASLVGAARVRGTLYRVGAYPGLVLDPNADWAHGELYSLHDRAVLAILDDYEGAGPRDPEPREFKRVLAPVWLTDGRERTAWIYTYAWPTEDRPVITSGDYLRRER